MSAVTEHTRATTHGVIRLYQAQSQRLPNRFFASRKDIFLVSLLLSLFRTCSFPLLDIHNVRVSEAIGADQQSTSFRPSASWPTDCKCLSMRAPNSLCQKSVHLQIRYSDQRWGLVGWLVGTSTEERKKKNRFAFCFLRSCSSSSLFLSSPPPPPHPSPSPHIF